MLFKGTNSNLVMFETQLSSRFNWECVVGDNVKSMYKCIVNQPVVKNP